MQVRLILRKVMWLLVLYMSVFGGRNLMYEQYDPENETSQQQKPIQVNLMAAQINDFRQTEIIGSSYIFFDFFRPTNIITV